MRSLHVLSVVFFSLTLGACGGGGGGGDSTRTNNQEGAPEQIVYVGLESAATLGHKNALQVSSNALLALDMLLTFSDIDYIRRPWFLEFEGELPEPSSDSDEDCESGSLNATHNSKSSDTELIDIEFENCVIDDVTLDGKITYELVSPENDYHRTQTATISYLALKHAEDKYEISGKFQHHFDGASNYSGNLTVRSRQQNRMFKLDNLSMRADDVATLSARFLDSQEGATDINFVKDSGTLELKGTGNAKISLKPITADPHPYTNSVTAFTVTLENSAASGLPISTQLSVDTLLEWSEHENKPPTHSDKTSLTIDRLSNITVDANEFFSDANDLLDFTFSTKANSECEIQKNQTVFDQLNLAFECQGNHTLTITASDGLHQTTRNIEIDVQPLAAEFLPIPTQELVAGQSLSIPVAIDNLNSDGPFVYSIAQGPAGISISPEGIIQGTPAPMINEGNTRFNINVQADNGKTSNLRFDIEFQSDTGNIALEPTESNQCYTDWQTRQAPERFVRACILGSSYVVQSLRGNTLATEYAQASAPADTSVLFIEWMDTDSDQENELVLGYEDRIVVVDYLTHSVVRTIPLPAEAQYNQYWNYIKQAGKSNHPLILLIGRNGRQFIFNLADASYQELTLSTGVHLFGDIDNDSQPEILLDDGTIVEILGGSNRRIVAPRLFETRDLRDLEGTGTDLFIRILNAFDQESNGAFVIKIARNSSLSSFQTISIPSPLDEGQTWAPRFDFMDVDGLPGEELLLRQEYDDTIYLYKLSRTGYQFAGSWQWDGDYESEALIPLTALPNGQALSTLRQGLSIVNLSTGQSTLIRDEQRHLLEGRNASLFREDEGGYSFFVSNSGQMQHINVNDFGSIEAVGEKIWTQKYDATSITDFDSDGDGIKEYIAVAPGDLSVWDDQRYERRYFYRLMNASTGQELSSIEVPVALNDPIKVADLTNDGVLDILVPQASWSSCLAWYQFGKNTPSQFLPCDVSASPIYLSDIKLIDLDNDGTDEVIALHSLSFGGYNLRVYRQQGEQLSLIINHTREEYASNTRATMGIQDVDADGALEIVVAEVDRFAHTQSDRPRLTVIEQDGQLRETISSAAIDLIPDILTSKQNASIVAVDFLGSEKLATRFMEIGAKDGSLIWSSKHYAGELLKGGFHRLESESEPDTLMAVTKAGILRFY